MAVDSAQTTITAPVNWRHNALLLALAGMEVSWFTPFLLIFHPRAWRYPPLLVALALAVLMLWLIFLAQFLAERQVDALLYYPLVGSILVVLGLFAIRLYVYWGRPITDVSWLPETLHNLLGVLSGAGSGHELIVLFTLAFLWWRGVQLLQREASFFIISYEFRRGVLLVIVFSLLFSVVSGRQVADFILPFFFFSLLAVALARVEDKSQVSGGVGRPFGPDWLGLLAGITTAVLVLALLLSQLYSLSGFRVLAQWLHPVTRILGQVLWLALISVLRLMNPLLEWLIQFLANLTQQVAESGVFQSDLFRSPILPAVTEQSGYTGPPAFIRFMLRYGCMGGVLVLGVVLLAWWLEKQRRERLVGERETLAPVEPGILGSVADTIRAGWQRLRDLAGLVTQFGIGRGLLAAISVRNIYANVIRLAEKRGYPRHPAQTPYEYLPILTLVFPGYDEELKRITEAYVKVHYGELPTTREELEAIRACWKRLENALQPT